LKVLVVCVPGAGHVNPLLPLVAALLAGGDRIVVCAGDDPGGCVVRSGAEFQAVGHGEMDWFGVLQARVRGFPGDGLAPERINHYFFRRLFGEIATADMIDDVLACGRQLQPDIVLFETYALAGPRPAAYPMMSPPSVMVPRRVANIS
jgi:hypothetical protein